MTEKKRARPRFVIEKPLPEDVRAAIDEAQVYYGARYAALVALVRAGIGPWKANLPAKVSGGQGG